jgi:hypothetical protein
MNATSEDEHQQQIGFQSLVEVIDTTTPIGQFFFQITGRLPSSRAQSRSGEDAGGTGQCATARQERRTA